MVGWRLLVSRLCRVWEPLQVQATKSSNVAYTIRISSLELCNWAVCYDWYLYCELYNFSLNSVSLPFCLFLSVFVFSPLQWSPTVGVSIAEPWWWYPSAKQELTPCLGAVLVLGQILQSLETCSLDLLLVLLLLPGGFCVVLLDDCTSIIYLYVYDCCLCCYLLCLIMI